MGDNERPSPSGGHDGRPARSLPSSRGLRCYPRRRSARRAQAPAAPEEIHDVDEAREPPPAGPGTREPRSGNASAGQGRTRCATTRAARARGIPDCAPDTHQPTPLRLGPSGHAPVLPPRSPTSRSLASSEGSHAHEPGRPAVRVPQPRPGTKTAVATTPVATDPGPERRGPAVAGTEQPKARPRRRRGRTVALVGEDRPGSTTTGRRALAAGGRVLRGRQHRGERERRGSAGSGAAPAESSTAGVTPRRAVADPWRTTQDRERARQEPRPPTPRLADATGTVGPGAEARPGVPAASTSGGRGPGATADTPAGATDGDALGAGHPGAVVAVVAGEAAGRDRLPLRPRGEGATETTDTQREDALPDTSESERDVRGAAAGSSGRSRSRRSRGRGPRSIRSRPAEGSAPSEPKTRQRSLEERVAAGGPTRGIRAPPGASAGRRPASRGHAHPAAGHRQAHGDHRARRARPDRGARGRRPRPALRDPRRRHVDGRQRVPGTRAERAARGWRPRSSTSAAAATASCTPAR